MNQPALLAPPVPRIADPLGRCYTPDRLAQALVDGLECDEPGSVLEPSVGGGAFVRAIRRRWPRAHIVGVDIDPTAPGLALCDYPIVGDWPTLAGEFGAEPIDLTVGNPPFGRAVSIGVTIAHVLAAIRSAPTCSLVLPCAYVSGSTFDRVLAAHPAAVVHRVIGRPWPAKLREVVAIEWREGVTQTAMRALKGWP